jgi:hypothetical protein
MADEIKPNDYTDLFRAVNDGERLKIREQLRGSLEERFALSSKLYAEQTHELRVAATSNSVEYGKIFVRSAFLLNGAAILALLTFISSLFGKVDPSAAIAVSFAKAVWPAFVCHVFGLVAVTGIAAIAYINWLFVSHEFRDERSLFYFVRAEPTGGEAPPSRARHVTSTFWAAVILGAFSIACFIAGALLVAQAFTVLGVT